MYIYCHSHLLNLSVQDAIENSMYDGYDTVHSTLVFLRDYYFIKYKITSYGK